MDLSHLIHDACVASERVVSLSLHWVAQGEEDGTYKALV